MNAIANPAATLPRGDDLPWVPAATPGKAAKLLRLLPDDSGFVELLRMRSGLVMPLHRHTGAAHVYQLSGTRRLHTGQLVHAGDYVFEPAGNVDSWSVVGDDDMLAFVVVFGAVEFLDPRHEVIERATASSMWEAYVRHCAQRGLAVRELRGAMA
jgi:quercetin dioxygenase-like cupin family protein